MVNHVILRGSALTLCSCLETFCQSCKPGAVKHDKDDHSELVHVQVDLLIVYITLLMILSFLLAFRCVMSFFFEK